MKIAKNYPEKQLRYFWLFIIFLMANWPTSSRAQKVQKLDFLIKNAWVFDGESDDSVLLNIGIRENRIVYVGNKIMEENFVADRIIEAGGLFLAPGFIDPHTHYDYLLNSNDRTERANLPCISQGVTTVVLGNDGGGSYNIARLRNSFEEKGIGTNIAFLVGFSSVRSAIVGNRDVPPDEHQIQQMKKLVAAGMEEGAFGLSTGLYYAPQSYAATDEIVALAQVAKKYNGVYDTHMRSESNQLTEAVEETINIGVQTGIPIMISHIKCLGPAAWGKSDRIIKLIEDAQAAGVDIIASQYPYIASHTSLRAMLMPGWSQSGGIRPMVTRLQNTDTLKKIIPDLMKNLAIRGGDNRIVFPLGSDSIAGGKSLHEVALNWNMNPEDAAVRILKSNPSISAISFSMDEDDVENFMKKKWVITCSDGGGAHPRTYGSFTRKIKEYSLDNRLLSLSQIINNCTGKTASFMGINKRGFIKEGYFADIVIFDPGAIKDNSTFDSPSAISSGVNYVFVNGKLEFDHGEFTGVLSGKALRHQPDSDR